MNVAGQDLRPLISWALSSQQHYPMPDMAAGGRAEREAVEPPPRPGGDGGLCPGEWDSELHSTNKNIWMQERMTEGNDNNFNIGFIDNGFC